MARDIELRAGLATGVCSLGIILVQFVYLDYVLPPSYLLLLVGLLVALGAYLHASKAVSGGRILVWIAGAPLFVTACSFGAVLTPLLGAISNQASIVATVLLVLMLVGTALMTIITLIASIRPKVSTLS